LAGLASLDLAGSSSGTGLLNGLALLQDVLGDSVESRKRLASTHDTSEYGVSSAKRLVGNLPV
jgi:hypothetical protein